MRSFFHSALLFFAAVLMTACGDSSGQVSGSTTAAGSAAAGADVAGQQAQPQPASGAIDLAAGEQTYGRFCFSCHAAGVAGAPKLGNAEDWGPRVAKGLDALLSASIEGIPPGMPARGLCMNCSDDDLRNTIAWMIAQ